jgi:hypothetical protein
MTVIRPRGLVVVEVDIEFNLLNYYKLEIDLEHINRGKNYTRETQYTLREIVDLVTLFIDKEILSSHATKNYGDESCEYYLLLKNFKGSNYKLVFCKCSDQVDTLGIITIYKIRS